MVNLQCARPQLIHFFLLPASQDFSTVSALELLVRANITVKSSIKHLVLKDAAAQVPCAHQHMKRHTDLHSFISLFCDRGLTHPSGSSHDLSGTGSC